MAVELSPGEYEVLRLVLAGFRTAEIAEIRGRSIKTVESQRSTIRWKLNIETNRGYRGFLFAAINKYGLSVLDDADALKETICKGRSR